LVELRPLSTPHRLIVGDVHGCLDELRDLLAVAPSDAELLLVGDLVAKGPDSAGVVALCRERAARAVRGNHDEHCLRAWRADRRGEPHPRKLGPAHRQVLATLDDDAFRWLDALPFWLRLPRDGVVVVHGGLVPDVALDAQQPEHAMTLRSITPAGEPSKCVEHGVPWASLWRGPERAVFGHDALRGLQRHPHALGLDTGCVYGGTLSALLLPEDELIQIPARRAYVDVT